MITDEVLEQVERVAAAATPGEWLASEAAGVVVAQAPTGSKVVMLLGFAFREPGRAAADLEIAALGHNLLPALVAEIRRLRVELATTDAALQACRALEEEPMVLRIPAGAKLPPGLQTGMVLLDSDEQEEPAPGGTPEGWEGPEEWEDPEERAGEERLQKYADAMAAIHARYPEQEDGAVEPEPASYANQPIGTCARCLLPIYVSGGYCGGCRG